MASAIYRLTGNFNPYFTAGFGRSIGDFPSCAYIDCSRYVVNSEDKKRARLNCISHLLSAIPYQEAKREKVKLPKRSPEGAYDDKAAAKNRRFVPEKY